MFYDWMSNLDRRERRAMGACFGGWSLDALDVQVYSYLIPTLMTIWGITAPQAGMLGTVALVLSAFGGWFAGALSDRFGRVRVLQVTIAWFAVFTFLSGFTNSFGQLFICRALQGIGFGGEWACGSVLIGEIVRAQFRGRAVGYVQSGWAVGWCSAAILYTIMFSILPPEWAWRTMFWIGILPAILVFYVRRFVEDPEIFRASGTRSGSPFAIFRRDLLPTTFLTALLGTGLQGGNYALIVWLPTFLKTTRGLSVLNTGTYTIVFTIGAFVGFITCSHFADAFGRRTAFAFFSVCAALLCVAYTALPISNDFMLLLSFPLGFCAHAAICQMGPFMTELFPTSVRATGQGFAYNAGRGIGAIFPLLVGYLATVMPLGYAISIFALAGFSLVVVAALLLPETRGRALLA